MSNLLFNKRGFALIMVLSTLALLTVIVAEFSFETKLNKIRSFTLQDRLQAKLNAESGIKFAMARLVLYQEGRNLLEKNQDLKKTIKPSMIETLLNQPFVYPVPILANMNLVQKGAIEEFSENSLIRGEMQISVTPVSGFLNPNNLRVQPKPESNSNQETQQASEADESNQKKSPQVFIEEKLVQTLKDAIESKREEDDLFNEKYSNLEAEKLIKELKFFVNHPDNFQDAEKGEFLSDYNNANITPKHAPLSSLDELYLLLGWDDEIVNLIKDRLTVHEVSIIAVNELTDTQLKIIFPDITPIQIEEFFKFRDGDQELEIEAQEFEGPEDFKNLVVNQLGILDEQKYDERIKELESAGLRIGVAGKLFKIESIGKFNETQYKLTAFVDLPVKPSPPPQNENQNPSQNPNQPSDQGQNPETNPNQDQGQNSDQNPNQNGNKDKTLELLAPRIIELRRE